LLSKAITRSKHRVLCVSLTGIASGLH
jgi:hypothetical protein